MTNSAFHLLHTPMLPSPHSGDFLAVQAPQTLVSHLLPCPLQTSLCCASRITVQIPKLPSPSPWLQNLQQLTAIGHSPNSPGRLRRPGTSDRLSLAPSRPPTSGDWAELNQAIPTVSYILVYLYQLFASWGTPPSPPMCLVNS